MQIGGKQAPKLILVAMAKEANRLRLLCIRRVDPLEFGHVEPIIVPVNKRSDQSAVAKEPDTLGRSEDAVGVARIEAVRRQELADQDRQVHRQQDRAGDDGNTVAQQLPPHHPPLRGHVEAFLRRRHPLDHVGVERRAGDVMREQASGSLDCLALAARGRAAGSEGQIAHRLRPACRRIRGSSKANARSEMNTPITVRNDINIKNDPARYMSWLRRASSSIGPVVGRDITTETIAAPEITCGSSEPISEMNGLSAIRKGYLNSVLSGRRPLARAVTTYCFCNSSSRLARNLRIMLAVPAVPMTMTGIQMWAATERTFGQVHG